MRDNKHRSATPLIIVDQRIHIQNFRSDISAIPSIRFTDEVVHRQHIWIHTNSASRRCLANHRHFHKTFDGLIRRYLHYYFVVSIRWSLISLQPFFWFNRTCLVFLMFSLNTLQTSHSVQDFNRQELNGGRGCKSCPNGDKAAPQTGDTIGLDRLDEAINESVVQFLVGRLIHERGTNAIKGRDG